MPPNRRPFPRFVADTPQETFPYGRFGESLAAEFATACEPLRGEAGAGELDRDAIAWFPERGYGGRVYVPAVARAAGGEGEVEFYGHVSFVRGEDGEPDPMSLLASADYTSDTAEANPDWQIDLNDDVLGPWKGDGSRGGELTLIWGRPLVRGAVAATAELDGETLDQAAVAEGRFTLVAVDAVTGFGDDLYLEVKLWDRNLREVASEGLYAESEPDAGPDAATS